MICDVGIHCIRLEQGRLSRKRSSTAWNGSVRAKEIEDGLERGCLRLRDSQDALEREGFKPRETPRRFGGVFTRGKSKPVWDGCALSRRRSKWIWNRIVCIRRKPMTISNEGVNLRATQDGLGRICFSQQVVAGMARLHCRSSWLCKLELRP